MVEDASLHSPLATIPGLSLPADACDCHCHIFCAADEFPTVGVEGYSPPVGPLTDYLAMADRLGFARRVFVQPAMYGTDSSCILDALRRLGPNTSRGIGGIPDGSIAESTLSEWNDLGICGVRVNYTPYKPYEAGFTAAILPDVERTAALIRELGWMLDILAPNWLTMELLPHLERMRVTYTLGHFAKFPARMGKEHPVFKDLLSRLADGEGLCWVKLCAAYQISDEPDFGDVAPLARALYEAAPDRVIWGTDWPHIRHEAVGDAGALLDLFGSWFPANADRRRILVENPARLFGFESLG